MEISGAPLPSTAVSSANRPPLARETVDAALVAAGWAGPRPQLLGTVTTSLDVVAAAVVGAEAVDGEGTAGGSAAAEPFSSVVAEATTDPLLDGHGPDAVAGSTLWLSVVLPPGGAAAGRPGWLSLAAALAVADAVRAAGGVPGEVVWPDVIGVPGAMCGGAAGVRHLARVRLDRVGDAGAGGARRGSPSGVDVVSLALRVDTDPVVLPAGSTTVLLDGGRTDRGALVAATLVALAHRHRQWASGDPSLAADYRARCRTIGRLAEVDGEPGWISDVDDDGGLLVTLEGSRAVRPAGPDALR